MQPEYRLHLNGWKQLGQKHVVQIGKFLALISRHTGWMDPGLKAANEPFALVVIGSAQNADLVPAFLIKHNGKG